MINKSLKILALSLIATNCIAGTGHGYKILSHKEEMSYGSRGWFEEKSIESYPFSNPNYSSSFAKAYNSSGYAKENITLRGDHSFNIHNYTNSSQTYTYTYELNCDNQYVRYQDVISIISGGNYSSNSMSNLSVYIKDKGKYNINASTTVIGESSSQYTGVATLDVID